MLDALCSPLGEKRPCPHHQGAFDPRWWCSGPMKMFIIDDRFSLHFQHIAELPSRKWISCTCVTFVFQSKLTGGVIHVQSCMDGIGFASQTGSNGGWLDAFAPRSERKLCRGRRNVLFKKTFDVTETNLRGSTSSLHLNGFRPSPLWSQLEWSMSQWSANRMPTARKQNGYRLERVCPFRSI